MSRIARVLTLGAVLLGRPVAARAQVQIPTRTFSTTATPTVDQLSARIAALEARVAQLESLLHLVNGQLVLDGKNSPVLIRGGSVTIQPDGALNLKSGAGLTIGSSMSVMLRAMAGVSVEAASGLDLKGSTIMLNGGTKPVACQDPRGCGATVLVP